MGSNDLTRLSWARSHLLYLGAGARGWRWLDKGWAFQTFQQEGSRVEIVDQARTRRLGVAVAISIESDRVANSVLQYQCKNPK